MAISPTNRIVSGYVLEVGIRNSQIFFINLKTRDKAFKRSNLPWAGWPSCRCEGLTWTNVLVLLS